jgi:hypothetical protein
VGDGRWRVRVNDGAGTHAVGVEEERGAGRRSEVLLAGRLDQLLVLAVDEHVVRLYALLLHARRRDVHLTAAEKSRMLQ